MNITLPRIVRATAALLAMLVVPLSAQDVPEDVALAEMLRNAARESASQVAAPVVLLNVAPDHAPVLVTQVFAEELRNRGIAVRTNEAEGADRLHVDVREMRFSTATGRNSSYLRNLTTVLGVLVSSEGEGVHRWSKEFTSARVDTLSSRPAETERDWLRHGTGFWKSVLEPAIVIAVGAVILVLLFTVRGSS